ncbi:hypothetical protein D0Y53_04860 [Luteimonas weifangensis]|uniref:Uncharacterized protein n=1 Tax=Cognatiluteimonas weifangensis TaxID=2303539 RepID=A0A372DNM3_9GAMM|nr:hypothetical protein D0Y53_04860 [Luteimonas weifangensis]
MPATCVPVSTACWRVRRSTAPASAPRSRTSARTARRATRTSATRKARRPAPTQGRRVRMNPC